MKLLTAEIEKKLPKLYSNEKNPNPMVVCKFFCPWSSWTWYAMEGERQSEDEFIFFGLVHNKQETELGYFDLASLLEIKGPAGLKIERDLYFQPTELKKIKEQHNISC